MLYIVEAMSQHEYVPKIPNQAELDLVFDISLPDVQPYLFKVCCWSLFFFHSWSFNVFAWYDLDMPAVENEIPLWLRGCKK